MLVKHNSYRGSYFFADDHLNNYKSGLDYTNIDKCIVGELHNQEKAALLFFSWSLQLYTDKVLTLSGLIENFGEVPIYLQQQGLDNVLNIKTVKPGEKYFFKISGLYIPAIDSQLRLFIKDKGKVKVRLKGVKINEGDISSDVYLPRIEKLSEDQKQLLPPEGDYKEIEPMRG